MNYSTAGCRLSVDNKSNIDIKIGIATPLKDAYYRNNRTSGQKSLRCFPDCCVGKGHEVHAFCGRSFVCKATLSLNSLESRESFTEIAEEVLVCHMLDTKPLPSCWRGKIPTFIMQIRPENEEYLLKSAIIDEASLLKSLRDGSNGASLVFRKDEFVGSSTGIGAEECYSGIISKMTRFYCDKFDRLELDIIFNFKLASWDYSWKSNRWSCDTLHSVDVIAYDKMEETKMLKLLAYVSSSSFQIVGTKVSRSAVEKEKLRYEKLRKQMKSNSELDIIPTSHDHTVESDTAATSSKHALDLSNDTSDESDAQQAKKMKIKMYKECKPPNIIDEDKQLKALMSKSMRDMYVVFKEEMGLKGVDANESREVNAKSINENSKKKVKIGITGFNDHQRSIQLDQMIIGEMTEKKILKLLENHRSDKNIYEIFSTVKGWVPNIRYMESSSKGLVNNRRFKNNASSHARQPNSEASKKIDESYVLPPYHVPRITASKEFVYDNLRMYQSLHATTYGINPLLLPQAPKLPTDIIMFPKKYEG